MYKMNAHVFSEILTTPTLTSCFAAVILARGRKTMTSVLSKCPSTSVTLYEPASEAAKWSSAIIHSL